MNTIIENAETLEYLTNSGTWTKNPVEGKSFGATTAAFAAARMEPIGKFNIVSYIAETRQFINLDHGRGKGVESVTA
jgi:alpha/beta superfamily hydrolase